MKELDHDSTFGRFCHNVHRYISDRVKDSTVDDERRLEDFLNEDIFKTEELGIAMINQGKIKWGIGYDRLGRLYLELIKNKPKKPETFEYTIRYSLGENNAKDEYEAKYQ